MNDIRVSVSTKSNGIMSENFATKEMADAWLLDVEEAHGIKTDDDGNWIGLFRVDGKVQRLKRW